MHLASELNSDLYYCVSTAQSEIYTRHSGESQTAPITSRDTLKPNWEPAGMKAAYIMAGNPS